MICHMSSWAVCGVRPSSEPREGSSAEEGFEESADLGMQHDACVLDGAASKPESVQKTTHDLHSGRKPTKPHLYIPHPKESIGIKCKRLIDFARVSYLRNHGFDVKLVNYVDRRTSLENVLLVVTKKHL